MPEPKISRSSLLQIQSLVNNVYSETAKWFPYNPDDIVNKKGSLALYYEMLKDYQIKSTTEIKKHSILGSDFEILAPVDAKGNEITKLSKITAFVKDSLYTKYDGYLNDDLYSLLSAMDFGYAVSEKIYKAVNGQIYLSRIRAVPPDSIKLIVDSYGEILENGLVQITSRGDQVLTRDKFILYTWNELDGNKYGQSDLRACYLPWFAKIQLIKYLNMYLERFGIPFLIGKYNTSIDKTETSQLKNVLKYMQASSFALVPEGVDIEMKETSQQSTESFIKAITLYDRMISISLLVPDLMGLTSSQTSGGSYALGEKQFDIYQIVIEKARRQLENIINNQLIKPLVDLNFKNIETYPTFKFKSLIETSNLENIRLYLESVKSGALSPVDTDVSFLRESLGFPAAKEQDLIKSELLVDPEKESSEEKEEMGKKEFKLINPDIKTFAEKFVDENKINASFAENTERAVGKMAAVIEKMKLEVVKSLVDQDILAKNNPELINTLNLPYLGNLKTVLERLFITMGAEGVKDAREESKKQSPESFALVDTTEIPITVAKQWLKQFALTLAIQVTGDIKEGLKKSIRNVLLNGIKNGKTTAQIQIELETAFAPYIKAAIIPGSTIAPYKLETMIRTNANTIYNQGRIAAFKDASKAGIVTHYQYSAILDARTSEICNELHGTVIPASDVDSLARIQPPRHYNCRSQLIPITKYRQEEMNQDIADGKLKVGLDKDSDFYDGFKK